jgi:hypothetical protein
MHVYIDKLHAITRIFKFHTQEDPDFIKKLEMKLKKYTQESQFYIYKVLVDDVGTEHREKTVFSEDLIEWILKQVINIQNRHSCVYLLKALESFNAEKLLEKTRISEMRIIACNSKWDEVLTKLRETVKTSEVGISEVLNRLSSTQRLVFV